MSASRSEAKRRWDRENADRYRESKHEWNRENYARVYQEVCPSCGGAMRKGSQKCADCRRTGRQGAWSW